MNEKQNIGSLFNRLAPSYDRFNHLSSLGIDHLWRRMTICRMQPAEEVIDVAVGTADLAIQMVRSGKAKQVLGIDISTEMMRVGEEKVARNGLSKHIRFEQASALEMPYQEHRFDALTCAYGVRNFSDLDCGLREFYRVLRPGGQLLILEFSYPQNRLIAWFYTLYFNYFMTWLGTLMTHDRSTFRYFYHSVRNFIWGDEMCQHLRAAGFRDVRFETFTFGISTLYIATK